MGRNSSMRYSLRIGVGQRTNGDYGDELHVPLGPDNHCTPCPPAAGWTPSEAQLTLVVSEGLA